jgi:hypothetical protein
MWWGLRGSTDKRSGNSGRVIGSVIALDFP